MKLTTRDNIDLVREVTGSADFERAYEIHGKHYDGKPVTAEEQEFLDNYWRDLTLALTERSEANPDCEPPFTLTVWLMFTIKYVTPTYADAIAIEEGEMH